MELSAFETTGATAGKTRQRLLDAGREIGELLMAFAAMDGIFQRVASSTILGVFLVGLFVFLVSILVERRFENAH